ncbi:hypothetical protein AcV5_007938 [Taiwanofungus camphoratus]|nr:hypothetical protein AcW2_007583 [Antrodia cinnamomea]KAI0927385.1 hypothetical protein AcV5_007938 [Antrodia cinnamomea]
MLHYFPTIYSIPDIHPIAICSGRKLPDGSSIPVGERTYSNSCTIKHGSFGNMGLGEDQYYSGGSDDFRAYVWEIPDNSQLLQHRERIEVNDWAKIENPDIVAFASARLQPRYIPVELSTPLCRLSGHQSIINTTLFHPCYPLAVTSGIERHIVLHSPTATSSYVANMSSTSGEVRALPMHDPASHSLMIRALTLGTTSEDLEDDVGTIALFDEILRQEGEGDVFLLRRWNPDSDEDMMSSDDDEDASEDWV